MARVSVKMDDLEQAEQPTTEPTTAVTRPQRRAPRFSVHYVVEILLVIAIVLVGLYAWTLKTDKRNLTNQLTAAETNPQALVQKQTTDLIGEVSKLISLPTDETPTIAAVTDVDAAKKQSAFFNNAQNGDKVLLYVKSGKAILYRPSTNKIIESQPLTINNSSAASATGTTTTKK